MQGRDEKFKEIDIKTKKRASDYGKFMLDYYNMLTSDSKSSTTKREYINSIIMFLSYYSNEINKNGVKLTEADLSNIKITDLYGYIAFRKEGGMKKEIEESTINFTLSALDSFLKFLYKCDVIKINMSTCQIKRAKRKEVTSEDIVYLNQDEIKTVVSNITSGVGNNNSMIRQAKWKNRDLLIFMLSIQTGIRVDALTNINIDDISIEKNTFMATDKWNKTRTYFIDDTVGKIITDWICDREELLKSIRGNVGLSTNKALFISNRGDRMATKSVAAVIKKYTYNIDKHITPHKLRSTCGTMVYQKTKDIYLVSNVLGHTTPAPTKRYAAIKDDTKKDMASLMGDIIKGSM